MGTAVELEGVGVRRGDRWILQDAELSVEESDRWVVVGPNGAGKTTLLSIVSARTFPTVGMVRILDEELGGVDLAELKPRIGWASSALSADIPGDETVRDVVMTGSYAVTGRWREAYDSADAARAEGLLAQWGLQALAGSRFGTLSEGERKRTLIARALMPDPELLLLDEPGAGLDLGGREDLVRRLGALAGDPCAPAIMMVTHHVEEIPPNFTHALVLGRGRIVSSGAIEVALTSAHLTEAFGLPIAVRRVGERWFAHLDA